MVKPCINDSKMKISLAVNSIMNSAIIAYFYFNKSIYNWVNNTEDKIQTDPQYLTSVNYVKDYRKLAEIKSYIGIATVFICFFIVVTSYKQILKGHFKPVAVLNLITAIFICLIVFVAMALVPKQYIQM